MENTKSKYNLVALLSTLVALGTHLYLSLHYYQIKYALGEAKSACNINALFNCDVVSASQFSSIFNIPIATFGLITHVVLLLLLLIHRFQMADRPELAGKWSFYLASISAVASIIMGTISFTQIGSLCLFCILAYLLSFVILFCTYKCLDKKPHLISDLGELLTDAKWILVFLALIPLGSAFANKIIKDNYNVGEIEYAISDSLNNWTSAPTRTFTSAGLVKGADNGTAKVTVVEFADFLCPHCKFAAPTLKAFTANNSDVQFIFKAFPLDGNCNPAIERKGDDKRCILAKATYCADKVSQKGWNAYEWIFEQQEKLFSADIKVKMTELSQHLQIPEADFNTCLASSEAHDAIVAQALEGKEAQIQGTPTIFVNNRHLERGQVLPVLQALYNLIKN